MYCLFKDLQFCKEYNVSGENYSEFFHIDSFKPSATVADADDTVINLRLYWMASQSAHILLSSNNNIDTSARVYEIGVYYSQKFEYKNVCLIMLKIVWVIWF